VISAAGAINSDPALDGGSVLVRLPSFLIGNQTVKAAGCGTLSLAQAAFQFQGRS
jgi:hypothetical protein